MRPRPCSTPRRALRDRTLRSSSGVRKPSWRRGATIAPAACSSASRGSTITAAAKPCGCSVRRSGEWDCRGRRRGASSPRVSAPTGRPRDCSPSAPRWHSRRLASLTARPATYAAARSGGLTAIEPWLRLREARVQRDTASALRLLANLPPVVAREAAATRAGALLTAGDSSAARTAYHEAGLSLPAVQIGLGQGDTVGPRSGVVRPVRPRPAVRRRGGRRSAGARGAPAARTCRARGAGACTAQSWGGNGGAPAGDTGRRPRRLERRDAHAAWASC